ncbi:putative aminotransferase protein [Hyaloraphidium curvatum]|nr:putative aminotransferase protein [Hyaloraphidium curvatum]
MSDAAGIELFPRPVIDDAGAAALASSLWGLSGDLQIRELGSNQDRNFRVGKPGGRLVLKIANRSWPRLSLEAQDSALLHIAAHVAGSAEPFAVPQPVQSLDGSFIREARIGEETLLVRVVTYLEGVPLPQKSYLAPCVVEDLGRLAGRSVSALADFDHPGLDQPMGQWDLRNAAAVTRALLGSIADPAKRAAVAASVDRVLGALEPLIPHLAIQTIHGDITDDNVVASPDAAGRLRPNGIIDFGDLGRSWRVGELAVTASCVLRHGDGDPMAVIPAIVSFNQLVPLTDAEISAFWPLVVLRGAVLVACGEHQTKLDPDNESATGALESETRIWKMACSVPFVAGEEALRRALGKGPSPKVAEQLALLASAAPLLPSLHGTFAVVDLSSTSEKLHSGNHLHGAAEDDRILRKAAAESPTHAACTRWAEPRLTRTVVNSSVTLATVPLGIDVLAGAGTEIRAPWTGTVAHHGDHLVLDGGPGRVFIRGAESAPAAGISVAVGDPLGRVSSSGVLRIRLCLARDLEPPEFVAPVWRGAWTSLCPSPDVLLGVQASYVPEDARALLARRDATFARLQEHYYADPMRIERGWRAHLVDCDARTYLDMVNNVAAIGHSHPKLAEVVSRQMRLLNTNSRFHYAAIAELCERLAKLAPEGLDTVFLVNSGSEAVDLALHMARTITGRQDVVAVREAYHGWTFLSDSVTTSLYDNPRALETRPDWIHLAAAPNSYRGTYRGAEAAAGYAADVTGLIRSLATDGKPPAAFICEPLFGNAGGVVLPDGYLHAAYAAVREAGGYAIADEVQVGLARTGAAFWAHELARPAVVPDIITVAKALGNGHPLGAVITRKEIADAFSAQGNFFSSAGGSPVSCVVGCTVLDAIRDEGLQENAARVGSRLLERLADMKERYPIVGAVHGIGLYLGAELVRDRETLEPATKECGAICDRLRELGVICQPTGERSNVLKIKPPMCISVEDADFFADQLEVVLRDGW